MVQIQKSKNHFNTANWFSQSRAFCGLIDGRNVPASESVWDGGIDPVLARARRMARGCLIHSSAGVRAAKKKMEKNKKMKSSSKKEEEQKPQRFGRCRLKSKFDLKFRF